MVGYMDMTFCSDAEQCKNKETCHRWLSPELQKNAEEWWGNSHYPVAYSPYKNTCEKWSKVND